MEITEQFISNLMGLSPSDRYKIKYGLPESYNLFNNLWRPVYAYNGRTRPTRDAICLVAKLYAHCPVAPGITLFHKMITDKRIPSLPFNQLEQPLIQSLRLMKDVKLNWVELTEDLSQWHNKSTRRKWSK